MQVMTVCRDIPLAEMKAEARKAAFGRRAACDPRLGVRLAGHVLAHCPPPPGAMVAGFWPMGPEIDIRPLMLALQGRGHALALPVTPRRGQPLHFRRWKFGDPLVPGPLGTSQPGPEAPPATPDFLLVPLLAFDAAGRRLGYGGGFYDRTLAGLPHAIPLGVAYACQQVTEVPAGPDDVILPRIATEAGIFECEA